MTSTVLTRASGAVNVLTLNRPERMNALNLQDRIELLKALRASETDTSCRAIVLTGGNQIFSAGGDIRSMSGNDSHAARERLDVIGEVAKQLIRNKKPVVAAIAGGAYGLGLSLACAADYIVGDSDSKYCASFGKIGLVADTGLFYSLQQRIGNALSKRMLLTAETLDAPNALRIGLIDEITEPGSSEARAEATAQQLSTMSAPAMAATRQILSREDQSLKALIEAETQTQLRLLTGEDFSEGQQTFCSAGLHNLPPNPQTHSNRGYSY